MANELSSGYKSGLKAPALVALVLAGVIAASGLAWFLAKPKAPATASPAATSAPAASAAHATANSPAGSSLSQPAGAKSGKPPSTRLAESKPLWNELNASQQRALRPLAVTWSTISDAQKRKWIALSQNYSGLPETEQLRLHERMVEWVGLSAQQRSEARLNFAAAKTLSAEQKQEKWQAYQALPPDERKKLAEGLSQRPVGAATALKPVPKQKLAAVPTTSQNAKPAPRIAIAPVEVTPDAFMPEQDSSSSPAYSQ